VEVTTLHRKLVLVATCLAFVVVVVGAYVRLMHAGLGCPDWPGCYGELTPAHAEEDIARAVAAQGGEHGPVSAAKAWKEMFHRYLAGTLGLLILGIAIAAWRGRAALGRSPALASSLLGVVILQAALGMWTVTLLLKPVIVTLHLLGGMATLSLLAWLALRHIEPTPAADPVRARRLRPWAAIGLAVVAAQIALGGWVSSNYAALACIDFPTCHGVWRPDMDFAHGFQLVRELGRTAAGTHLAYEALTAIHWTHRVGAVVTLLYGAALSYALARSKGLTGYGVALAIVLAVQIGLGVTNIVAGLPLAVAVAHNAVAAILLVTLVVINFALSRVPSRHSP
jgi:cytochrome c oxidase assembly protein subunit 15